MIKSENIWNLKQIIFWFWCVFLSNWNIWCLNFSRIGLIDKKNEKLRRKLTLAVNGQKYPQFVWVDYTKLSIEFLICQIVFLRNWFFEYQQIERFESGGKWNTSFISIREKSGKFAKQLGVFLTNFHKSVINRVSIFEIVFWSEFSRKALKARFCKRDILIKFWNRSTVQNKFSFCWISWTSLNTLAGRKVKRYQIEDFGVEISKQVFAFRSEILLFDSRVFRREW